MIGPGIRHELARQRDRELARDLTHRTVTRAAFISAMSGTVTGVSVVTTDGASGRLGLTVSSLTSVSADPPMLLVCINRRSPSSRRSAPTPCSPSTSWARTRRRSPTRSPAGGTRPSRTTSAARSGNAPPAAPRCWLAPLRDSSASWRRTADAGSAHDHRRRSPRGRPRRRALAGVYTACIRPAGAPAGRSPRRCGGVGRGGMTTRREAEVRRRHERPVDASASSQVASRVRRCTPKRCGGQPTAVARNPDEDGGSEKSYAYAPDNVTDRSPYYSINLPCGSGKGPYEVWKNETGTAYVFERDGAQNRARRRDADPDDRIADECARDDRLRRAARRAGQQPSPSRPSRWRRS